MGGSADVDRRAGRPRLPAGPEPGRRDQAGGRGAGRGRRAQRRTAQLGSRRSRWRSWTAPARCRGSSAGSPATGWPRCWPTTIEPDDPGPEVAAAAAAGAAVPETVVRREPVTPECARSRRRARDRSTGARRRDRRHRADRRVHRLRADRSRLPGAPAGPPSQPRPGRRRPGRGHARARRARADVGPGGRRRCRRTRSPTSWCDSLRDLPAGDRHRRRLGQGRRAGRALAAGGRPEPLRRVAPDGRLPALRPDHRPGRPVRRPHLGGHPAPALGRRPRSRVSGRGPGLRRPAGDHGRRRPRRRGRPGLPPAAPDVGADGRAPGHGPRGRPGARRARAAGRHPGRRQRSRAVGADRRRQLGRRAERAPRRPATSSTC